MRHVIANETQSSNKRDIWAQYAIIVMFKFVNNNLFVIYDNFNKELNTKKKYERLHKYEGFWNTEHKVRNNIKKKILISRKS